VLPVLVLTAGLGTRLDPLTRLVAKPAVPLGACTLIERVIGWLHRQGVREAVLNLHHRPETITGIVGDGAHLGLRIRYSWEQALLGSAGGPRRALPLLPETFVIVNGDTLCEMDLPAIIAAHTDTGASVTMAVVPNPAPDHYNGIVVDDQDRVRAFVATGHTGETWHFVGIQIVSASLFLPLADGQAAETVAGIYRDGVAGGRRDIYIHRVNAPFIDVGTPRDYLEAALFHASIPDVHPSANVRRSVIWRDSSLGPNAAVDECVVAGVDLPAGFTARRAVLVPASVVRPGESVTIVGDVAVFPFLS
jgi:NDP-sugar pyrophosphorylase family protein